MDRGMQPGQPPVERRGDERMVAEGCGRPACAPAVKELS